MSATQWALVAIGAAWFLLAVVVAVQVWRQIVRAPLFPDWDRETMTWRDN